MSEAATVHAGCVAIGGRGVLITGPSGAGKSDLAIRLIDRGAALVSDDYTVLTAIDGALIASAPERIAGKIELRGVGILEQPYVADTPVALAIVLVPETERLPEPGCREWLGHQIPAIAISGLEPSAPIKVEAALAVHGLAVPCRP